MLDLQIACEHGDIDRVRSLINEKYKKDFINDYNGLDLLTIAIMHKHENIVKMLVEEFNYTECYDESNISLNNISGMTHFMWAIRTSQFKLALYLIQHNFNYYPNCYHDIHYCYSETDFKSSNNLGPNIDDLIQCLNLSNDDLNTVNEIKQTITKVKEEIETDRQKRKIEAIKEYIIEYDKQMKRPFITIKMRQNNSPYSDAEIEAVRLTMQ